MKYKIKKRIGRNIYDARLAVAMTQAALAKRVGVTVITVSRWENGHAWPSEASMEKLAQALGLTFGANVV